MHRGNPARAPQPSGVVLAELIAADRFEYCVHNVLVPQESPRDPRAAVYTNNFETDVSS